MHTQDIDLGILAHPEGAETAPVPGVVLVPDVWGLSDLYRDFARRLASEGLAVLAVDLYRREGRPALSGPADAVAFCKRWPDGPVLEDVQAAIDRLGAHPAAAGRKVGVTGFCVGGQQALLAACTCRGLAACVSFYGMLAWDEDVDREAKPRSPLEALPDLTCPVLGLYGAEDVLIPLDHVRQLEEGLAKHRQPGEVIVYPGAGHAFLNEGRPEAYRPEAARDAWARMVAFFREHLAAS